MEKNHILNHSLNQSLTQLIWCPGDLSFCFGISINVQSPKGISNIKRPKHRSAFQSNADHPLVHLVTLVWHWLWPWPITSILDLGLNILKMSCTPKMMHSKGHTYPLSCSCDLILGLMSLTYKLDLDTLKIFSTSQIYIRQFVWNAFCNRVF